MRGKRASLLSVIARAHGRRLRRLTPIGISLFRAHLSSPAPSWHRRHFRAGSPVARWLFPGHFQSRVSGSAASGRLSQSDRRLAVVIEYPNLADFADPGSNHLEGHPTILIRSPRWVLRTARGPALLKDGSLVKKRRRGGGKDPKKRQN